MPIKDIVAVEAWLQNLYADHVCSKETLRDGSWYWSDCHGNHDVSGNEWEVYDNPCYFSQVAANFLGLPDREYPKYEGPHAPSIFGEHVANIWGREIKFQTQPMIDVSKIIGDNTTKYLDAMGEIHD